MLLAALAPAAEQDPGLQLQPVPTADTNRLAAPPETDRTPTDQVQPGDSPAGVSILVHFDGGNARAADLRADVKAFATQRGGKVKYEYQILPNVINLRNVKEADIPAIRAMPGVINVERDLYYPKLINLHDSTPLIRGLQSQIAAAGHSADGAGVRVAVIDTGIDSDHLMYADRIDTAAGRDFNNGDNNPEDDNGHGSHVAGIAVGGAGLSIDFGCGAGSQPFQGVAPEATLIGVKILNQFGGGFDSNIIAGIDYAADQSPSGGRADVINLSIGIGQFSGPCTHSWAVAANNAAANGVVVVAASGNENFSNALSSPACGSSVIAVGMTWKADYPTCEDNVTNWNWGVCSDFAPDADDIGCFSNESDFLDVAAPGANIWSASNAAGGTSITGNSGTSMASPQVAGLAALILSVDGSLTPAEVRQIIRDGSIDLGAPGFDRAYGWGRIDVLNSLALVGPGCTTNGDCDDGNVCNGLESCVAGSCQPGAPLNCNDGNACTSDSCNPATGCVNTPITCNDGDPCTTDSCNSGSGCVFDPVSCPPGEVCVGGTCEPQVCDGDTQCESGEDCNNCASDCIGGSTSGAICGNGICEAGNGEDCLSCPADCNGKQNGNPAGRFCCGDGDGQNPLSCAAPQCSTGGWSCTDVPVSGGSYCCGDGTCQGEEDSGNCSIDCGAPAFCGDANCDPGEDECNCAVDCGSPPITETNCTDGQDEDCDGGADCNDPSGDCDAHPSCSTSCGNGNCEPGEDCNNCSSDCEGKANGPPSGRYCCGNGILEGPEADGRCDGNP
jgi:subtilisin family serine protease